jgi:molybdate/tungstate transport system substrate-binding protein
MAAGCGATGAALSAPAARSAAPSSTGAPSTSTSSTTAAKGGDVSVLYAGSLVNLMEHRIGPAFDQSGGYHFRGFAAGAIALANQIRGKLRRADVFISAAPAVNNRLMGQANGNWVSWYIPFADAPLVIGYSAKSRFASQLKTDPWYQVMAEPGFRLGRTDPKLDPKGALTVQFLNRAARYYHRPGLTQRLLGTTENPAQVFPEETLVGRLQAGQLDAGFFYSNEAVQAHIPYVTPPAAVDLKAAFTVTIVRGGADPAGAEAFVRFLLGPRAQAMMKREGLVLVTPRVVGDAAAMPAGLRTVIE